MMMPQIYFARLQFNVQGRQYFCKGQIKNTKYIYVHGHEWR